MQNRGFDVVTGAFGYSGRYITRALLQKGRTVKTLTNSPQTDDFANKVQAMPLCFDKFELLVASLTGADTLYNTYWVRFDHGRFSHRLAVQNTKILFAAAKQAGVRRVVHISITHPSENSQLDYFRGKAQLEAALKRSGLSYAILRPTVLFGEEDILINNITWLLRHFPVFALFGRGDYRLQPIFVGDLAQLAVQQGGGEKNCTVEAIGPETFSYRQLVETITRSINRPRWIVAAPPLLVWFLGWLLSLVMRDVTITRAEIRGLMSGLLHVDAPAAGSTKLTTWLREHVSTVGTTYTSELARRDRGRLWQRSPDKIAVAGRRAGSTRYQRT